MCKQAQRAMFALLRKARSKQLPIDVQLHLFDATVVPVLTYGCEIWGYENVEMLEKLQLKFYKYMLCLPGSTSSCMVRGELGRMHIMCEINKRIVNMWSKLININHSNKLPSRKRDVLRILLYASLSCFKIFSEMRMSSL